MSPLKLKILLHYLTSIEIYPKSREADEIIEKLLLHKVLEDIGGAYPYKLTDRGEAYIYAILDQANEIQYPEKRTMWVIPE